MVTADESMNALGIVRFGPEALDCHVDEFRALKYLGQRGQELTDELADRFQDAIRLCESIARPRGVAVASRSSAAPTASRSRAIPSS